MVTKGINCYCYYKYLGILQQRECISLIEVFLQTRLLAAAFDHDSVEAHNNDIS